MRPRPRRSNQQSRAFTGGAAGRRGPKSVTGASPTRLSATCARCALTDAQRALLAQVPQSAESFALIPTAAALEAKLRANPITRDEVQSWEEKHSMPARWMMGGADVLLWRDADGGTHYLVQADP